MSRVADRVSNDKIVAYIKKYGPVSSNQVREKFGLAAPTFYTKIKQILGLKITQAKGNVPMILEFDHEATL